MTLGKPHGQLVMEAWIYIAVIEAIAVHRIIVNLLILRRIRRQTKALRGGK